MHTIPLALKVQFLRTPLVPLRYVVGPSTYPKNVEGTLVLLASYLIMYLINLPTYIVFTRNSIFAELNTLFHLLLGMRNRRRI